jgi:hypothetical protein
VVVVVVVEGRGGKTENSPKNIEIHQIIYNGKYCRNKTNSGNTFQNSVRGSKK